jgi:hypothetical protein
MYGLEEFRLEQAEIAELWRELGSDYARYGMNLPKDAPPSLTEGFKAQRHAQSGKPLSHDKYVRKWLNIRRNALLRERKVPASTTVEAIRAIDTPTCPVTLVELTKGAEDGTDWSVDRLNNDLAYALGNILIMSTKANLAKGTKTLDEVRELAQSRYPCDGLQPREWARLEALMYGPCQMGKSASYPVRQVAPLYRWVIRESFQEFQDNFIQIATRVDEQQCAEFFLGSRAGKLRTASQRLLNAVHKRLPKLATPYDVWFDHEVFDMLRRLPAEFAARGIDYRVTFRAQYPSYPIEGELKVDLSYDSRGRLFEIPKDPTDRSAFFRMRNTMRS